MSGKGCFVIGSGPSLREIDVSMLRTRTTIAFNRSYIAFQAWGFTPTYYAALDPVVLQDNESEIEKFILGAPFERIFLNSSSRDAWSQPPSSLTFVELVPEQRFLSSTTRIGDLGNVGASSLQLLAALGFRRIALVGIDGRYTMQQAAEDKGDGFVQVIHDVDHFSPEYGSGKRRVANPDLNKMMRGWEEAAVGCRQAAVEVRNASPGSAVSCFNPITFTEALRWIGR